RPELVVGEHVRVVLEPDVACLSGARQAFVREAEPERLEQRVECDDRDDHERGNDQEPSEPLLLTCEGPAAAIRSSSTRFFGFNHRSDLCGLLVRRHTLLHFCWGTSVPGGSSAPARQNHLTSKCGGS